ncbi:hypothetical protein FACS189452_00890 [Bacteroidia bacterium]|nr:hypothetical protein FACS189452_00890 [Bacteroidia bacterium]
MTQDEYNIMQAKLLLPDPVLHNVLDTTLRIAVGNDFYKITPDGTFITKRGNEAELYDVIQNFEQIKQNLNITDFGSVVDVTPSVKFVNTFQNNIEKDVLEEDNSVGVVTKATTSPLYSGYNVDSYKWASKTWVGKALDWLFGTDATRSKEFTANKRVEVELFRVNYLFYVSSGVKVKMQQRKYFWFFGKHYFWVDTDEKTDDIAIGFDAFTGKLKLNAPKLPIQTQDDAINALTGYLNGVTKKIIYKGYNGLDFMKDFSSTVRTYVPCLDLPFGETNNTKINNAIQTTAQSFLNNATPDAVYNLVKGFTGSFMGDVRKYMSAENPRSLYVMGNPSEITTFLAGVSHYGKRCDKVVRFDMSFGIKLSFTGGAWSGSTFLPSTFEIKGVDMFGAAYYNGQWRGVRFSSN